MIKHLFYTLMLAALPGLLHADMYLVVYATHGQRTGHSGIAVDNYEIVVEDVLVDGKRVSRYDTVKLGTLTYFDLWPLDENVTPVTSGVAPRYFKLPAASSEPAITLHSLVTEGVARNAGSPIDGLIRIPNPPLKDYELIDYMDSIIAKKANFHPINFNCSDLAELGVEKATGIDLNADELVLFVFVTTPNRLFQEVEKVEGALVLLSPGNKINHHFFTERGLLNPIRHFFNE